MTPGAPHPQAGVVYGKKQLVFPDFTILFLANYFRSDGLIEWGKGVPFGPEGGAYNLYFEFEIALVILIPPGSPKRKKYYGDL